MLKPQNVPHGRHDGYIERDRRDDRPVYREDRDDSYRYREYDRTRHRARDSDEEGWTEVRHRRRSDSRSRSSRRY